MYVVKVDPYPSPEGVYFDIRVQFWIEERMWHMTLRDDLRVLPFYIMPVPAYEE